MRTVEYKKLKVSKSKKNIKEDQKTVNTKKLYYIKSNEIIINKNYVICEELLKNINYLNMFSNKSK
ncbi:MAG: hypothetical protein PHU94_04790 [Bacilli bacterium]|nr:hypothetical protein [Bacilli bacterium]MDD4733292.1 hypothetical protein [Bacilli bacterium]